MPIAVTGGFSRTYPALVAPPVLASLGMAWTLQATCAAGPRNRPCAYPAQWVRVTLPVGVRRHVKAARAYCDACGRKSAHATRQPLLGSRADYDAYLAAALAFEQDAQAQDRASNARADQLLREQTQQRRQADFAAHGRTLAASGLKGQMFERPDGSLETQRHAEPPQDVCCWHEGMRRIDNRIGGRPHGPGHAPGCVNANDGAA